eukprot:TRINITY_DN1206_c0_g1_i1.p1 TRINITY_DN1206_c0_g1~~TRINITY_DN1206_c0_g1_i1.p1  ORF type:complete len:640 (-),score=181.39 TRINITY_DN1206_c0_g1_i1:723-2642(-)
MEDFGSKSYFPGVLDWNKVVKRGDVNQEFDVAFEKDGEVIAMDVVLEEETLKIVDGVETIREFDVFDCKCNLNKSEVDFEDINIALVVQKSDDEDSPREVIYLSSTSDVCHHFVFEVFKVVMSKLMDEPEPSKTYHDTAVTRSPNRYKRRMSMGIGFNDDLDFLAGYTRSDDEGDDDLDDMGGGVFSLDEDEPVKLAQRSFSEKNEHIPFAEFNSPNVFEMEEDDDIPTPTPIPIPPKSASKYVPPSRRPGFGASKGAYVPPHKRASARSPSAFGNMDVIHSQPCSYFEDESLEKGDLSFNVYYSDSGQHRRFTQDTAVIWGHAEDQGSRKRMEDRYIMDGNMKYQRVTDDGECSNEALFAVFDGHLGTYASDFCATNFISMLLKEEPKHDSKEEAMRHTFLEMDKLYLSLANAKGAVYEYDAGSTASVCWLRDNKLYVANLGDSRSVMCIQSEGCEPEYVKICEIHTPEDEVEAERIKANGGWVTTEESWDFRKLKRMDFADSHVRMVAQKNFKTITARVNSELGVSRSIGDPDYKGDRLAKYPWAYPKTHDRHFHGDLVCCEPSVACYDLEENTKFLILACDGIWDVIGEEHAVEIVHRSLENTFDPTRAAEQLISMAKKLGSTDNITCVVVCLNIE